jgi:SLT domain-containing protein
MGCGCKKKNNDTPQTTEGQSITVTVDQTETQPTSEQVQDQVIQVAATLRDMIENKEL